MKALVAFIGSMSVWTLTALVNQHYLRLLMKPFPAEKYEVFVYSIVEVGPFLFLATCLTIYFAPVFATPRTKVSNYAFGIGMICVFVVLVMDVIFMPRVRFR